VRKGVKQSGNRGGNKRSYKEREGGWSYVGGRTEEGTRGKLRERKKEELRRDKHRKMQKGKCHAGHRPLKARWTKETGYI